MANNDNYNSDTFLSEWYPIVKANFADIYDIAEEHKKDASNPHKVTKSQVGLGNVDNTSDKNKPVSNAVQAALDKKTDKTSFEKHTSDKTNPHGVNFNQVKSWADVKPLGNLRSEFKTHNNKDGVCYEYIGEETFGRASIVMFGVSESYPDYDFADVKINGVSYNIVDCKGNEVAYLDEDIVYVLMLSDEGTAYIIGHFGIKNGSITSAMLSTTLMSLIDGKAEKVHTHGSGDINDIDATPTKNSNYLVSSGGVYAALSGKAGTSHTHVSADITDKDTAPTENSGNLITSGGVYGALENMFSNDDYYFTDLNTITKPGAYGVYCESKDAAGYNYPEGKSCGSLLVVSTVDGVNQIFVGQDNTFYTRLIETVSNECHEWKGLTDKINNELDKINNELFEIKEINFVNLSDFIKSSGSNYYDFSEKVGEDYFWVYNDFEEGISELYYNDDVKYVFTAEIGVGKYVKIKVEKNVVSSVDVNTDGEISVSPIQYNTPHEYVSKKLDKEFNSNGYKNIDEITAALKSGLSGGTASGSHTHANKDILDGITGVDTTPTSGSGKLVTSGGVYGALSGKQATVTGGASTITSSNLTASRALVSNASGKVAVSDVTSTELGYLDGVKSNVQTQLDGKQEALDYNASDFLGCIEEVSQLCFEFGEELNFTNYAPQVKGIDVALNIPCSGTDYATGKVWIDGSPIYRKDFAMRVYDTNIAWGDKCIIWSDIGLPENCTVINSKAYARKALSTDTTYNTDGIDVVEEINTNAYFIEWYNATVPSASTTSTKNVLNIWGYVEYCKTNGNIALSAVTHTLS